MSRYVLLAFALLLVACKGKSSDTATGSGAAGSATGSATMTATGSASGSGSASETAGSAAGSGGRAGMMFDGPTFYILTTLPGPETKQKEIDTDAGKVMATNYTFGPHPDDPNSLAMVNTNPIPVSATSSEKLLESSLTGMIRPLNATVDDKKFIDVDGTQMLDFTSHWKDEDGEFFFRGRVAFVNNKLYQVVVMGTGTKPAGWADAFVTSFRVK